MRTTLNPEMERARYAGRAGDVDGHYVIAGPNGMRLEIIASSGWDWTECELPQPVWEHVSVSAKGRTPTWYEMEWVREQFWEPEELVLQLSVPRKKHINLHPHVLHLWKPVGLLIPLPPPITVGPLVTTEAQGPVGDPRLDDDLGAEP